MRTLVLAGVLFLPVAALCAAAMCFAVSQWMRGTGVYVVLAIGFIKAEATVGVAH